MRRFVRNGSMSIPLNSSYDSEYTFFSHDCTSSNDKITNFVPTSSPSHSNQESLMIFWLKLDKQGNSPAMMPEEMCWKDHLDIDRERNEQLFKPGSLELCNNPDYISYPAAYKTERYHNNISVHLEKEHCGFIYREANGRSIKLISMLNSYFPIMNPHTKVVQRWNKFLVFSCLVAIFADPLFFFLLSMQKDNKCLVLNWSFATSIATVRCVTDFIYFLHMLLQFRLAYVAPESTVVGAGVLVDQPKQIALRYIHRDFILDLSVALPLPQIVMWLLTPSSMGSSSANYAKDLLRTVILIQYLPRMIRFLQLLAGQSTSDLIFESAWTSFIINLLMYLLAGHVVGSCWYLFGLQRVNHCLQNTCSESHIPSCELFIDCGDGSNIDKYSSLLAWRHWLNDSASTNCFSTSGNFAYGIYGPVVLLTTKHSIVTRYIYSLCWGFLQITTLAGNQAPSYFVWEVLFLIAIMGLGLLLFAWLLGNMQNFLQALGRRRFEMQLRQRDVEQWMSHRRLPEQLRRQVRRAERFNWAATQGVNEEDLLENLPEDIQREVRRHFFKFVKNVRIFTLMDEPVIDAICEKLRQKFYIRGSNILYQGDPLEKMVFIVRGKVESIGIDGNIVPLSEGDVCGGELLTWYLENSSMHKDGGRVSFSGLRLLSTRTVKCLTSVETFALRAADLEEVTNLFPRLLRNPHIRGALRYESPYWRYTAATRIQAAWRYRQKRLKRNKYSNSDSNNSSHPNTR